MYRDKLYQSLELFRSDNEAAYVKVSRENNLLQSVIKKRFRMKEFINKIQKTHQQLHHKDSNQTIHFPLLMLLKKCLSNIE